MTSITRSIRRRIREERGAALVEFALVLPVLLLLILGTIYFGAAFNYWIDETHLANEAARFAAVDRNPGPAGTLQQSIQQQADSNELRSGGTAAVPSPGQVCIDFPNGTQDVGDPVRATMSVTYHWLPFLGSHIGIAQTTITGSATMRLEAVPSTYSAGCA